MGERLTPTTGSSSEPSAARRRPSGWTLASVVARLSIPVMLVLWAVTPPPLYEGELWYQTHTSTGADATKPLISLTSLPREVALWRPGSTGEFERCEIPHRMVWSELRSSAGEPPVWELVSASPGEVRQEAGAPLETLLAWLDAPAAWNPARAALRRSRVHTPGGSPEAMLGLDFHTTETRREGKAVYAKFECVQASPRPSLLDVLLDVF